jgi:hypothetical protein
MPRPKKKQKRVPAGEPDVAEEDIDVASRNTLHGTGTRASQRAASAAMVQDLQVAIAHPVEDDEANEAALGAAATGELERGSSLGATRSASARASASSTGAATSTALVLRPSAASHSDHAGAGAAANPSAEAASSAVSRASDALRQKAPRASTTSAGEVSSAAHALLPSASARGKQKAAAAPSGSSAAAAASGDTRNASRAQRGIPDGQARRKLKAELSKWRLQLAYALLKQCGWTVPVKVELNLTQALS